MNKARAREIATIIREHDELWDQESWFDAPGIGVVTSEQMRGYLEAVRNDQDPDKNICGSRGCVAGWAASLYSPAGSKLHSFRSYIELPKGFSYDGEREVPIELFAKDMLGLDGDQAGWLFGGSRSKEQVLWALENENDGWDYSDCPYGTPDDEYEYEDYDDYSNEDDA
jgi:hypothetical protein